MKGGPRCGACGNWAQVVIGAEDPVTRCAEHFGSALEPGDVVVIYLAGVPDVFIAGWGQDVQRA